MPNTISALPSSFYQLSHDPTQSVIGDVDSDIAKNPYTELTQEIMFGLINDLLVDIDNATGLDLLDIVAPLEHFISGGVGGLLSNFFGFLTPGTGVFPNSNSSTIGGPGNVLSVLFDGAGSFLTHLIPDITAELSTDLTGTINTVTGFLGGLFSAFTGHTATTPTVAGTTAAAAALAAKASSAVTTQSQQATAKPNYLAGDATADATFPLSQLTGATSSLINVTAANSVGSFVDTTDNTTKSSVCWLGQGTTNLTAMYITLHKLNVITGVTTIVEASANIISLVSNVLQWNYYDFNTPVNTGVGDVYFVELSVVGTGTYQIAGEPVDWKPPNTQAAFPHLLGSGRQAIGTSTVSTTSIGAQASSIGLTHTPAVNDNYALIYVAVGGGSQPQSATYGGVAMTRFGNVLAANNSDGTAWLACYGVAITPGQGPKAVNVVLSGTVVNAALSVHSYPNVGSAAFGNYGYSQSTSMGVNQGQVANEAMVVVGSAAYQNAAGAPTVSATNGATRRTLVPQGHGTSNGLTLTTAEVATTAAVNVTNTFTPNSNWGAISVVLTAGTTPPQSAFTPSYFNVVPWFGMGSVLFAGPSESQFTVPGTYTYTIPNWMKQGDIIDMVIEPAGGGGSAGHHYLAGNGGGVGQWLARSIVYGIDIPTTTKTLTLVVGAGGAGQVADNSIGNTGYDGGDTQISGVGMTTLDAVGGPGGGKPGAKQNGDIGGYTLPDITFNGKLYLTAGHGYGGQAGAGNSPGFAGGPGQIFMSAYQAGATP